MARNTAVPAQIMTVEDKIVGTLGMTQIILLGVALIGSGAIFLSVAPTNKVSVLKVILLVVMNIALCGGAIRYKGDLLMRWAFIGLVYALRPRYWIYDKRSSFMRPNPEKVNAKTESVAQAVLEPVSYAPVPSVDQTTQERVDKLMQNPAAKVRFVNSKGGFKIVFTTETKQEI